MERIEYKKTELILIPKYERYMEYMLEVILLKLPRTEKYSIGTEYKLVMYETLKDIMYVDKIIKKERLYFLNRMDSNLNTQRVLLRIMYKYRWISEKQFNTHTHQIVEQLEFNKK